MSFYFCARYGLFTYSQCADLNHWAVLDLFSGLGAECIIGRELHEDGGTHLHVFADFGRRFRSRSSKIFDCEGRHPNVSASRGKPDEGWDYAIKDGDVVAGGLERPDGVTRRSGDSTSDQKWGEIAGAEDRDEFWRLVHELDPKSLVIHFPAISKYCDWKFSPRQVEYVHPINIDFVGGEVDGRDHWLAQAGIGLGGTGKSPQMNTWGPRFHPAGLRGCPTSWFITGVVVVLTVTPVGRR
ncbi:RepA [pteropus associated gemycircularvirus 2]|uniref:RepA n=1 Tax=pteropus associated gemycircularvirus 2 TaxID=1985396 RepID=A0A140CTL0_9VIRU|nr:RepA [Pacific flying fox faeces associated gemycircularvirus-2]AMH87667.1 RepA [Pacific flying fox faeces associated gemycircularvirus-2]